MMVASSEPTESSTRRRFLQTLGVGGAATISSIAGCMGGTGGDNEPRLNVGIVDPLSEPPSLLSIPEIQNEVAENINDSYTLEVANVGSTPQIITQLAAGELQLGTVAPVSFGRSILNKAVPGGLTAVASEVYDAHEEYFSLPVHSLEDSGVSEIKDLEGTKIGINALGTGVHATISIALEQHGIDPESDVDWIEIGFSAMGAALREGKIDSGIFVPVFTTAQQLKGGIQTVFTSGDVWSEGYDFGALVARNEFLENQSDPLESFLEDYVATVQYVYENRDTVVELVSEKFELPVELLDQFYLTEKDFYRPLDGRLNLSSYQQVIDALSERSFLDESITVDGHITNEYLP